MKISQPVMISGPAGQIQALVEGESTSTPKRLGIVCHPHPLHHGTMNNKVVTTLVHVFQSLKMLPIRFNFRGVGQSEGSYGDVTGELADLRAVIAWAKENYPHHELVLAGFSFGAYIAARVATEVKPAALISIAPAVHHNDYESLPPIDFPWVLVQGDADEIVPPDQVFHWVETLAKPPKVLRFQGVGHFFHGKLIPLREQLLSTLQPLLSSATAS